MLKIQANTRDISIKYTPINLVDGTLYGNEGYVFIPKYADTPRIVAGDVISFYRKDGESIEFSEERIVMDSDVELTEDSSIPVCASIVGFNDIPLFAISATLEEIETAPNTVQKFIRLVLRNKHNYIANRDSVVVNAYVNCSFQNESGLSGLTNENVCPGDYVIYNDIFLYRLMDVTNGRIDIPSSRMENYRTNVFVEYEGETARFPAIIPCNLGGKDNTSEILIYGDDEMLEDIASNPFKYTFYGNDERFFTKMSSFEGVDGNYFYLRAKTGTSVRLRVGDMRLSLPVGQIFDASMSQMEAISQYSEEIIKNVVNDIVDYEKQQFIPVYSGKDVQKLLFKIHLRVRDDDWNTNDSLGWVGKPYQDVDANSVEYMGFDKDDIYYQKKKVSMSFLRVSFYNTPDRRTQKLLYTAKIYLNSSDLYGQYVDNVAKGDENPLSAIGIEFVCTHKYDYEHSTEGFYLHLFPSNLSEIVSGTTYMKFELNNAKYGKTIPLVLFKDGFREGYIETGTNGSSVNMDALYKDLYSEVIIRKNDDFGRYEWEISEPSGEYGFIDFNVDGDNALTFHLVEPRVNGVYGSGTNRQQRSKAAYDEGEYDSSCPSDITYCPSDVVACPSDGTSIIDSSIDMFFGLNRSKPYDSDTVDRNYNSDNSGYSVFITNKKYKNSIVKFSTEPGDYYLGYRFDGWGGYDGKSFHSTQTVEGQQRSISIKFSENKTEDVHYYYIELLSPGGTRIKTLTVRQWPVWGQIGLSATPMRADFNETTKTVRLMTGTLYEELDITETGPKFYTYTATLVDTQAKYGNRNLYIYEISVHINRNGTNMDRTAEITFAINEYRSATLPIQQTGNPDATSDGYIYSIEASINPSHISEIREGRKTNYEITGTLYKTNGETGVREESNDWSSYAVGLYSYCEPKAYKSYGYKQVKLSDVPEPKQSTAVYNENDEELKYATDSRLYCFAGIVDGQIVRSQPLKITYDTKLLKYTAFAELIEASQIAYNASENRLSILRPNYSGIQITGNHYLAVGSGVHSLSCSRSITVANSGPMVTEPGQYYLIVYDRYGGQIQNTITAYTNGTIVRFNDNTDSEWNYDDVQDNVYLQENYTGTYRYNLGDTPGERWVKISQPLTLTPGTFTVKLNYKIRA